MTPIPQANGYNIHGAFTAEKIVNIAGDSANFINVTAPIDCKGYKVETTDATAPYSYDFFYQTLFKTLSGDTDYTVIRNGEFKAHVLAKGQSVGFFKAETGKTIRISFVD